MKLLPLNFALFWILIRIYDKIKLDFYILLREKNNTDLKNFGGEYGKIRRAGF